MIQIIGLILALIVLIYLVFKQVPTVFCVLCAALTAGIFNRVEVWTTLNTLAQGTGSTFASYMFVFLLSTIYGELMSSLGCANAIADFLVKLFGKKNVVVIIILTTGLLVYGGVTAMVVCFTVCPIGISLLKEANISKKFLPAMIAFGQGTFALTALPGTPQLNNIIPTEALHTTSTAAPVLGMIAAVLMFVLGTVYLQHEVNKSKKRGEGFEGQESIAEDTVTEERPKPLLAFMPMILLVVCYMAFENLSFFGYRFSDYGAYTAISSAMVAAIAYLMLLGFASGKKKTAIENLGKGAVDWIMPLLNFSMIVGFGSVIKITAGFSLLTDIALNIPGPKYISAAISVCLLAGVTGSASGGMKIALSSQELVANWMAGNMNASAMHRIVSVASCGLDSLPHCGGILATLNVCHETHASSYKYIFVTTVLVPILATAVIVACACMGLTF